MKRIFVLVSPYSYPRTGAHIRFDRLAIYLSRLGHDVIWLSPKRNDIDLDGNVKILDIGDMAKKKWVSIWMALAVFRHAYTLFKLRKVNVLLISFGETNLIPSAITSFLSHSPMSLGMRSDIKKCNELNSRNKNRKISTHALILMPIAMAIWGWIYRSASQVTVQTPGAKASAIANFRISESRLTIIENDLPIGRTTGYKLKDNVSVPRRALFIGDDSHIKGFDVLLDSISGFGENASTIKELTVVGVSAVRFNELQCQSQKGGLRVIQHARTDEIISLMAKNDLLIVPSREDQFPNVVLEALSLGLPVIGSDTGGVAYILMDRWLLFEPGNAKDLLKAISRVSTPSGYSYARQVIKLRADRFSFCWEERYFNLLV